jgi:hypothetical protein
MKAFRILIGFLAIMGMAYACTKSTEDIQEQPANGNEAQVVDRGLCSYAVKSMGPNQLFAICGPNAGAAPCNVCNVAGAVINSQTNPTNAIPNYTIATPGVFSIVNVSAFPIQVVVGANGILAPAQTIPIPVGGSVKVTANNNCTFVLGPC